MREICGFGWVGLMCLAMAGCNQRDRAEDLRTPAAPGPLVQSSFRIVSGADLRPVADARVTFDSGEYRSNEDGYVHAEVPMIPGAAVPIDIDAPGFLPRRTMARQRDSITLWPIADETEAAAVRAMVYGRPAPFGSVLLPIREGPFYVSLLDYAGVEYERWVAEASSFARVIDVVFQMESQFQYDSNEITVRVRAAPTCTVMPAWGFCLGAPPYKNFEVHASVANDPKTIRRVLASALLGPNPLPGFMNADAPADELSPLELQTIRMIRQRPRPNRWPDTDR